MAARWSRLLALVALHGATAGPAAALDTLRVGLYGNLSWSGTSAIASVQALPPEYKVERTLSEVGSTPGNLIDLTRLQDPTPRVLIKTVFDASDRDTQRLVDDLSATVLAAIAPVPGVADVEVASGSNLFTILVTFSGGTDLAAAAALLDEALDAVRPVSSAGGGSGGGGGAESPQLECTEESRQFESSSTVTEEWGACESALGGVGGFQTTCYRVECRNRDSGEITFTPGRLAGKPLAAAGRAQDTGGLARLPDGVDPVVLPVALSPNHIATGENVAHRALGWGGRITAPAITDVARSELEAVLLELITPEGFADAFERKGARGALGTFVVLDLGAPVGVNRVRFYPRNTVQSAPAYAFQNDFLRQFELMLHDGHDLVLDGSGRLVPQLQDYEVLKRSVDNQEAVVDVPVSPPRLVRFVRLKAISSLSYELDEFEVFGQGFISQARYLSPVYDLGAPATWGSIHWIERFVDLGQETAAAGGSADDNCEQQTQSFATAAEIDETWGDCGTVSEYRDNVGYVTVWNCFQTVCRDESGRQVVTAGRGKPVARAASRPAQLGDREELSRIAVRTRTGSDPTPLLYWRRNVERTSDPERSISLVDPLRQLGRAEYLKLAPDLEASPPLVWDRGEITEDLEQWSPWSAPYRSGHLPGGEPILSPGPRRYIQFSVEFENDVIDATKMVEQLSLEYLQPPIADDLIAEIYPRQVEAFETVPFTYAVRALMDIPGVKGFDRFEVSTPTRILGLDRIQVLDGSPDERVLAELDLGADIILSDAGEILVETADGRRHSLPYESVSAAGDTFGITAVAEDGFTVRFPVVARPAAGGQRLVKIDFRSRVLLYSTVFRGAARFSGEEGTVQRVTPGNAGLLGEGDLPTASGITVLSPAIAKGNLVGALVLSPNPFTPNGDGVNDLLDVSYDITAVTRAADVTLRIFDLSGRQVRELYRGQDLSGHFDPGQQPALRWDGRDDAGHLVAPGVYLLRATVEGDARSGTRVRTIAVAY